MTSPWATPSARASSWPSWSLAIRRAPRTPPRTQNPNAPGIRQDLQAVRDRHALGLDPQRPDAVAKRHDLGRRTARENLADLVDKGTFVEYGPLIFAAQEGRRAKEELIQKTPADGLVAGVGDVNGHPAVVMSYDYTVLAGTQGMRNHLKKDRLFEVAERRVCPWCCSRRAVADGPGTSTGRTWPASTAWPFTCSRA